MSRNKLTRREMTRQLLALKRKVIYLRHACPSAAPFLDYFDAYHRLDMMHGEFMEWMREQVPAYVDRKKPPAPESA